MFTICYCDRCGDKIREKAWLDGSAVQYDEKSFCQPCQEPLLRETGFQRYLKESHLEHAGSSASVSQPTVRRKRRRRRKEHGPEMPSWDGRHVAVRKGKGPAVMGLLAVGVALVGVTLLLMDL